MELRTKIEGVPEGYVFYMLTTLSIDGVDEPRARFNKVNESIYFPFPHAIGDVVEREHYTYPPHGRHRIDFKLKYTITAITVEQVECGECAATGRVTEGHKIVISNCPNCHGTGKIYEWVEEVE